MPRDPLAPSRKCPCCDEQAYVDDDDVFYAVPVGRFQTMGGPQIGEGGGHYFHDGCEPPAGWQRKAEAAQGRLTSRRGWLAPLGR
jgi:hypothetical protein